MLFNIFSALNLVTVLALFVAVSSKPTRDFRNRRLGNLDPRGFAEHKLLKQFNIRSDPKRRNLRRNDVSIKPVEMTTSSSTSPTGQTQTVPKTSTATATVYLPIIPSFLSVSNSGPTPTPTGQTNTSKTVPVLGTASATEYLTGIAVPSDLFGDSFSGPAPTPTSKGPLPILKVSGTAYNIPPLPTNTSQEDPSTGDMIFGRQDV